MFTPSPTMRNPCIVSLLRTRSSSVTPAGTRISEGLNVNRSARMETTWRSCPNDREPVKPSSAQAASNGSHIPARIRTTNPDRCSGNPAPRSPCSGCAAPCSRTFTATSGSGKYVTPNTHASRSNCFSGRKPGRHDELGVEVLVAQEDGPAPAAPDWGARSTSPRDRTRGSARPRSG